MTIDDDALPDMLDAATWRGLVESAPFAMLVVDDRGTILLVNAQAEVLFGHARADLQGQPIEVLVPAALAARHRQHIERFRAAPRARPLNEGPELFARHRDGHEFPVEVSLSPLHTPRGLIVSCAVKDLTERRQAEERERSLVQAREALRLRDEFLAVVSHELKTPLTALQLRVQGLLRALEHHADTGLPTARLAPALRAAGHAVERLDAIVDNLLDLSHMTEGRIHLEYEDGDLVVVAREATERLRGDLAQAGCTLGFVAPAPVPGRWDRVRIGQMLTSLLSNAARYGGDRPVEVRIEADGPRARIVVQDHGIGIDEAQQQHIFERFARLSSPRHYGGFGLGLWVVRQVAQALGGTVHVDSHPGEGARFTIELPREGVQTSPAGAPAAPR